MLSKRLKVRVLEQLGPHRHPEECWAVPVVSRVMTLGRLPYNEVVLPYPSISGVHARAYQDRGRLYLEDLQSRNGTFLNGFPVVRGELVVVRPEDVLQLGSLLLCLELDGLEWEELEAPGAETATCEVLCFYL